MMYSRYRYIILLFFILFNLISDAVFSQSGKKKELSSFGNTWMVGANLGPDFFYGDLGPQGIGIYHNVSVAGSIYGGRQFSNVFGLRGQFLFSGIKGRKVDPEAVKPVNLSFSGPLIDFNINATINFSNLFSSFKPSRQFFVYGTLGFGITSWNTKVTDLTTQTILQGDTIRNWKVAPFMPFGLGAFVRITDRISVNAEWTFRMAFSDLLDQTSGGFKYDFYDCLSFGVQFSLGKMSKKSPKVKEYPYPVYPAESTPSPANLPVLDIPPKAPQAIPQPGEHYTYVVQIFAFAKRTYNPESIRKRYHISQPVRREREGRMNRYLIGNYQDLQVARNLRDQMIKKGIHDSFVVAYKNGVRDHIMSDL
jgi:hypothetical protein